MNRSCKWLAALMGAAALCGAVTPAALALKTGPHFFVGGAELGAGSSKNLLVKTLSVTKIVTAKRAIECSGVSAPAGTVITGGSPGTGHGTLKLEGCKTGTCEIHSNTAGEVFETGVIKLLVNLETTFDGTEAQALAETPPLGILLRSNESKKTLLAKVIACNTTELNIEATGNNREGGFGAPGQAAAVMEVPSPEVEQGTHEAVSTETTTEEYRYWDEKGNLQNVKAKLELNPGSPEPARLSIRLFLELEAKPTFSIRAK